MLRLINRIVLIVCLALSTVTMLSAQTPTFSFGIVADIQYDNENPNGKRNNTASIRKLTDCVADWNAKPLAFTIQLGDIIDGNVTPEATMLDLHNVMDVLVNLRHPLYHVVGNHCVNIQRTKLLKQLSLDRAYYAFVREGWRFIILDCMDVSMKGRAPGSEQYDRALAYRADNPEAKESGGGISDAQKYWLAAQLQMAGRRGERVMIFSHRSIFNPDKAESVLIWNAADVRSLIDANDHVAVAFNGHHHEGGYGLRNGVHYVTLEGMVQAPETGNGYGVVDVYEDWIEIMGIGNVTSRVLQFGGK
jgi:manganese-dependent ADP-ribose/CDP-alcohol diphosphatase